MITAKERFMGQAPPELLALIREIARAEGRDFEAAQEDAMRLDVERKTGDEVQPDAIVRFRTSLERNRRLYELLSQ